MNRNKRKKIHPKYYAIEAYEILSKKSSNEIAETLGITERTYKDKINGYSDFSRVQGEKLAEIFGKPTDEIFLI